MLNVVLSHQHLVPCKGHFGVHALQYMHAPGVHALQYMRVAQGQTLSMGWLYPRSCADVVVRLHHVDTCGPQTYQFLQNGRVMYAKRDDTWWSWLIRADEKAGYTNGVSQLLMMNVNNSFQCLHADLNANLDAIGFWNNDEHTPLTEWPARMQGLHCKLRCVA